MYTLRQIASITNSSVSGTDHLIPEVFFYDSRSPQPGSDACFVALQSSRNNGHLYIPSLISRGVKTFIVKEGEIKIQDYKDQDVSFVVTKDPLLALQQLAVHHRAQFTIPVIGITGSNGKTIVKEWLYQLLKNQYTICRSPKSYNSQIGVALSVLQLRNHHTLAIFEAGISMPGEMDVLQKMIRPTIGVFTSLGTAHDEGFSSRGQKISEKLMLFRDSQFTVVNGLTSEDVKNAALANIEFISREKGSAFEVQKSGEKIIVHAGKDLIKINVPFTDEAYLSNAATCAAVLYKLGINPEKISEGLQKLQPVALRLELKNAVRNSLLINDFYNSDLDSLKIALNYMDQQSRRKKKVLIVSDMEQSGMLPDQLYQVLSKLFEKHSLHLIIGVGSEISAHADLFKGETKFFTDTGNFVDQFKSFAHELGDSTILLKGARSFGFERISSLLQLKSHDTEFEINLQKLTSNINYYKGITGPSVKMMCMVKATGYGSGSIDIARTLEHSGVNYLAVAYADEGVELRESQINLPIMVMSPETGAFEDIINFSLEPEIYSFSVLKAFVKKLEQMGIGSPYPIHIKIDTGMHRLGFEEHELPLLMDALKESPQVNVVSVFSHLAGADSSQLDDFTNEQIRIFEKAFTMMEDQLGIQVLKHICNSAGITRFKKAHYDMVRLGIGMYGIGSSEKEQEMLQNVGTLKTRISQVKELKAGETVGYNRSGKVDKKSRIAIIPIGYADGFHRLLGNGRHGVYIRKKFCPTIGNICMDMCMIDVTGVDCAEDDEVIVFENTKQIFDLAKAMNTIPYEVLTSVSARVKRVYVQE